MVSLGRLLVSLPVAAFIAVQSAWADDDALGGPRTAEGQPIPTFSAPITHYNVYVLSNEKAIQTTTRLDGSQQSVITRGRSSVAFLTPPNQAGGWHVTHEYFPSYPPRVAAKLVGKLNQVVPGIDSETQQNVTKQLAGLERKHYLSLQNVSSQANAWVSVFLAPDELGPLIQPYLNGGNLRRIGEVDISAELRDEQKLLGDFDDSLSLLRTRSAQVIDSLASDSKVWVAIVMKPEFAGNMLRAADPGQDKKGRSGIDHADRSRRAAAASSERATCTIKATDPEEVIGSGGYRYLQSLMLWTAAERDVRFSSLFSSSEEVFTALQTGGCAVAILPAAKSIELLAAMRRENMDFIVLVPPSTEDLAASYQASLGDWPLQERLIAQSYPALAANEEILKADRLMSLQDINQAIERMRASDYPNSQASQTVLQYAADEIIGKSKGISATENLHQREADGVKRQQQEAADVDKHNRVESDRIRSAEMADKLQLTLGWAAGIAGLIGVLYALRGMSTACPECKRWHAARTLSRTLIDLTSGNETRFVTDVHRDRNYKRVGTTTRQVQVQVTRSKYELHQECTRCSHRWYAYRTSTSA